MAKCPPSQWLAKDGTGRTCRRAFRNFTTQRNKTGPEIRLLSARSRAAGTMRGALVLLAAVLPCWPGVLGQYAPPQQNLSFTMPSETFSVRAAPFLPNSRGHLLSAADELGRTSAPSECVCIARCLVNDNCFSFSYDPASTDCRLGRRRGRNDTTESGPGMFRVRPGLAQLGDFCWSDSECSRVTPAARCQDSVCVTDDTDLSKGTTSPPGGLEATDEGADSSVTTDGTSGPETTSAPGGSGTTAEPGGAGTSTVPEEPQTPESTVVPGEPGSTSKPGGPESTDGIGEFGTTDGPGGSGTTLGVDAPGTTDGAADTATTNPGSSATTDGPSTDAATDGASTTVSITVATTTTTTLLPTSPEPTTESTSTSIELQISTSTVPSTTKSGTMSGVCSRHPHCQLEATWSGCQGEPCRCPPGQKVHHECRTSPTYDHVGCYGIMSGDISTTFESLTGKECRDFCSREEMPYFSLAQGTRCNCYRGDPSTPEHLDCLQANSSPCAGDATSSCGGPDMMDLYVTAQIRHRRCTNDCADLANAYCGTCRRDGEDRPCCLCESGIPYLGAGLGCRNAWFKTVEPTVPASNAPGPQSPQELWAYECPGLSMLVGLNFPSSRTRSRSKRSTSEEEQHVEPPNALKCNVHTNEGISMVSALRDQRTAVPVTAVGEVTVCPARAVVTGLFDESGTLQTVELLLCAPLADDMVVSDLCYNLPTRSGGRDYSRGSTTPETEGRSQCHLVTGEVWAVVGLAINTDGSSSWVETLRCCLIYAV